jgi:hypothetical protein
MSKLACKCGHVFDLVTIPSPEGYSIVADGWLDSFGPEATAVDIVTAIDNKTPEMYICTLCGRLAVFWERGGLIPVFYIAEDKVAEDKVTVS